MPRIIWLLVLGRAVNRIGAFSLPFLAVLLTQQRGWTPGAVGLTLTCFGLATIPSRLAGGRLADRVGRRTTIVLGLSGCAVAQVALAATTSAVGTVLAVVALGLAFEVYEPPSQALVADHVEVDDQPAAHSLLAAALAAGGLAAGILAVVLSRIDLRWLFVADAASCLACATILGRGLPPDRRPAPSTSGGSPDGASPWRDRRLLRLLLAQTVFAVVYLQSTIALPLSLLRRGLTADALGVLMATSAVTFVVAQPLLRWRVVRAASPTVRVATGYGLLAVGLLGYAVATTLEAFLAATTVVGLGDVLLMGQLISRASALAPARLRARYLAVFGTSWGFAAVVAPVAGTGLLGLIGVLGTWTVLAGVCLAMGGLALADARRPKVSACAVSPPTKPPPVPRRSRSRRTTSLWT